MGYRVVDYRIECGFVVGGLRLAVAVESCFGRLVEGCYFTGPNFGGGFAAAVTVTVQFKFTAAQQKVKLPFYFHLERSRCYRCLKEHHGPR